MLRARTGTWGCRMDYRVVITMGYGVVIVMNDCVVTSCTVMVYCVVIPVDYNCIVWCMVHIRRS